METRSKQTEFKYFDIYRVSHHIGSELIEIEVKQFKSNWFRGKEYWKRIYFGHPEPIKMALEFYEKSKKEEEV